MEKRKEKKKKTPPQKKTYKERKEAGKEGKTEGGREEEDTFLSEKILNWSFGIWNYACYLSLGLH